MRRSILALLSILFATGTLSASAQVVPSATAGRQLSLTVGGLGSAFQPDYGGGGNAATSPNRLYGLGAYVDFKITRWVQIEAEGRWLRFNQFENINESNYLIGPRIPIHSFRFLRATPYAKVLAGYGKMTFEYNEATGHFTDIAYGGGVDFNVTRRLSIRAPDFEYQQWPKWVNNQELWPYGVSVGVGYRIF
jgi:opacity protein-like surface antigen